MSLGPRGACIWCFKLSVVSDLSVTSTQESDSIINRELLVRRLGTLDYSTVWEAMQTFTDTRTSDTPDEMWCLQHPAVFTQGQAGKAEHLLSTGDIPVLHVDRGGQVTYHGPGQLVAYLLINLKRRHLGVRALVTATEQAIIRVLALYGICAHARRDAPGVYVDGGAKIAQLGFRVRKGCSFHGLSLNVDMDLEPFSRINPCGYQGLVVTSIAQEMGANLSFDDVTRQLVEQLGGELGYTHIREIAGTSLPV